MKVLILSTEFPPGPGGIGTHAFELASGLRRLGDQVRVMTMQDYVSPRERLEFNARQEFEITTLPDDRSMAAEGYHRLKSLVHTLRAWKPNICIASGGRSVWMMAAIQSFLRIPWLAVGHGTEILPPTTWARVLTRWSFNQADLCIAVSNFSCRKMIDSGIRQNLIRVVPNGANPVFMRKISEHEIGTSREEFGFSADQKLLLTVGNLSRRKGQDVVIRALPEVVKAGWNAHYWMVGMPTLQGELTELAANCGVQDRVHFGGQMSQERLILAYKVSDIFLMTSRYVSGGDYEGYGIAAIEAALAGKPVVVSRSGGLPETIVDHETGIIVEEDDPASTARGVIKLLDNPDLAARLGSAGRQRAVTEGLWLHRVDQYRQYLNQLLTS